MLIIDTLLIGGIRFVLDKLATAVETELNDDTAMRERLLTAQMRLEVGEITEEEFAALETEILAQLRALREERQGSGATTLATDDYHVTRVDATFEGGHYDERG